MPCSGRRHESCHRLAHRYRLPPETPQSVILRNRYDSIRTIPALQHSDNNPEDLDTDMEDHAADEWRYGAMSHPFVKIQTPDLKIVKDSYGFDEPEENDWKTA